LGTLRTTGCVEDSVPRNKVGGQIKKSRLFLNLLQTETLDSNKQFDAKLFQGLQSRLRLCGNEALDLTLQSNFMTRFPAKPKWCPFRLKRSVFASFSQQAYPAFALEKRT